ncbi:MAG: adenylate/guanylate cyclase domain-containing protein [SAR324 cluster bacterium]|nr:adenylate/guanylate cyclase domain-containing protein [SAR324 cluster bacterium]
MKKRYYFSMLSLIPLVWGFGFVYLVFHQSIEIFLTFSLIQLILYGIINTVGIYFIYKPIDRLFVNDTVLIEVPFNDSSNDSSIHRINHLTRYSTFWAFFLGMVYVFISIAPILLFPSAVSSDVFEVDKIPLIYVYADLIPGLSFVYAIFPAFIIYFLINDYTLDLKSKIFSQSKINYDVGKKKIGTILFLVFLILVLFPALLVILELTVSLELKEQMAQFTQLNPLETVLINRFVVFIGMIISVILLTRSFTKPIYSLLKTINIVSKGDYTAQAPVITGDEIGILTKEFNEMVKGLKEREFIRDTFGKYVTKDVANVILKDKINLGGEVRLCTVLVTDIANYTTISEELSPQKIVKMLNEYFSVQVEIIHNHNGVVNEFIGDSIFAMFNVPLDDPNHATNAIKAALEIEKISASRQFGNNRLLTTRMGINTGMVVAGNIGSEDRMKYTVIGDEVNVAARLEQLNKQHGTLILLGENTYELTKNHFDFSQLGDFQLKGKEKTIKVYKVNN